VQCGKAEGAGADITTKGVLFFNVPRPGLYRYCSIVIAVTWARVRIHEMSCKHDARRRASPKALFPSPYSSRYA